MEIIIERFELERYCKLLRLKKWQLGSYSGCNNKVRLHFIRIKDDGLIKPVWNLGMWGLSYD